MKSNGYVLIVDDIEEWQDHLRKSFAIADIDCVAVSTYKSAVEVISLIEPSLLILDLQLREMTEWEGWILAEEAYNRNISSIIVTGQHIDPSIWHRAYRDLNVIKLYDKATFVDYRDDFLETAKKAIQITQQRQANRNTNKQTIQQVCLERFSGRNRISLKESTMGEVAEEFIPPFSKSELDRLLQLICGENVNWDDFSEEKIGEIEKLTGLSPKEYPGHNSILDHFGIKLYNALAYQKVGVALQMVTKDAVSNNSFSLTLHLQFSEDTTELIKYPWELIHDTRRPLVRNHIGLTRGIAFPQSAPVLNLSFPLRVLFLSPRPLNQHPRLSNLEGEQIRIALKEDRTSEKQKFVFSEQNSPVTYHSLVRKLNTAKRNGRAFHIVHYDGHGIVGWKCPECGLVNEPHSQSCQTADENGKVICDGKKRDTQTNQGYLAFEDNNRCIYYLTCEEFASALAGTGVQIVMLSACNTAKVPEETVFNSIATKLIEEGIPVVIGMQFPISIVDSTSFFTEFYRALGAYDEPDQFSIASAVRDARKILSSKWFYPVLYWRVKDKEA